HRRRSWRVADGRHDPRDEQHGSGCTVNAARIAELMRAAAARVETDPNASALHLARGLALLLQNGDAGELDAGELRALVEAGIQPGELFPPPALALAEAVPG